MDEKFYIPRLIGGGLVLGYRCSSRCRHCLYGCGPHRRDGEGDLERILDALAERGPAAAYHIGGGEPFLDIGRLARGVAGMVERGLRLDYVETNAAWVRSEAHAEQTLAGLSDVGLDCVLVSLSPFHAEFIPLEKTLTLARAAERVLRRGAFVWIVDFLKDIGGSSRTDRLDLDALIERRGASWAQGLASRYGLITAGRAGRFLAHVGQVQPWEAVTDAPCATRLSDTSHFHVDLAGGYVPGLCAGILLPFSEVPGPIDLERYPILQTLVSGGPGALVERALGEGFEPLDGYSSACDLCTHVRSFFFDFEQGFAELGPAGFYDPRSVPVY